jgi:SnoaL-like domain
MTTSELAKRLYELCEKGDFATAQKELYANDATSTESTMQGTRETVKGKAAIEAKSQKFNSMLEQMHSTYTKPPQVFGNYIFMEMGMDAKMKNMDRMNMVELARYEIKDGKIIADEFYY